MLYESRMDATTVSSLRRRSSLAACLILLLCAAPALARLSPPQQRDPGGDKPSHAAPSITATPNPVPSGSQAGKTTLTWNTGDGTVGEVYLYVSGQPEKLFTRGAKGSKDAPWINAGPVYEFRLYAGTDRKKILASVKVTRNK